MHDSSVAGAWSKIQLSLTHTHVVSHWMIFKLIDLYPLINFLSLLSLPSLSFSLSGFISSLSIVFVAALNPLSPPKRLNQIPISHSYGPSTPNSGQAPHTNTHTHTRLINEECKCKCTFTRTLLLVLKSHWPINKSYDYVLFSPNYSKMISSCFDIVEKDMRAGFIAEDPFN